MTDAMSGWLEQLAAIVEPAARGKFILFGSAALRLRGVELGRNVGDLDVFVSNECFVKLGDRYDREEKQGNDGPVYSYRPEANIEILQTFPGVTFTEVERNATETDWSQGFPVGALVDLRRWKVAQGRPKDQDDIARIDDFLLAAGRSTK